MLLTFGNVSAVDRARGLIAIKASGVPYRALDRDAIVVLDLESGATVEGTNRPSLGCSPSTCLWGSRPKRSCRRAVAASRCCRCEPIPAIWYQWS
jgi:L-ribulose-5-phosphate 4-epimerase